MNLNEFIEGPSLKGLWVWNAFLAGIKPGDTVKPPVIANSFPLGLAVVVRFPQIVSTDEEIENSIIEETSRIPAEQVQVSVGSNISSPTPLAPAQQQEPSTQGNLNSAQSLQIEPVLLLLRNNSIESRIAFETLLISPLHFTDLQPEELLSSTAVLYYHGTAFALMGFFTQVYDQNVLTMTQEEICYWIHQRVLFVSGSGRISNRSINYLVKLFKPSERHRLPQPGDEDYIDIAEYIRRFPPFARST